MTSRTCSEWASNAEKIGLCSFALDPALADADDSEEDEETEALSGPPAALTAAPSLLECIRDV